VIDMPGEAISLDHPALAPREGDPPVTTRPAPDLAFPHQQLTQLAPERLQDVIVARASTLPHVELTSSCVSVPGSRAFRLDEAQAHGPAGAFQCGTEFAHVHPAGDGSLHLTLPPSVYEAVIDNGWGEPHPISGTMLLFGPRNRAELEVIWQVLLTSYRYALGTEAS
jgi:phospholipase/carboxylesterase